MAVKNNNKDIVGLLLSKQGINVNIPNNDQDTALHLAVKRDHTDIVELLLKNPNIKVDEPDTF